MPKLKDKPFVIPKPLVWQAYRRVRANKGAPGVDGQDLDEFEADLQGNLYRIWNRMSSGSYFPPAVRAVQIPKPHGGGVRMLGVPTIADRVAQTVVAMHLEPLVEPKFHPEVLRHRSVGPCRQGGDRGLHRPVGAAVCQAVAGCAAAARRRHARAANQGNSAGIGAIAGPGEPVHALRV